MNCESHCVSPLHHFRTGDLSAVKGKAGLFMAVIVGPGNLALDPRGGGFTTAMDWGGVDFAIERMGGMMRAINLVPKIPSGR